MDDELSPAEQKLYDQIIEFAATHGHMPSRSYLASCLSKDGSVISKQCVNLMIKGKLKPIAPPMSYCLPDIMRKSSAFPEAGGR